MRRRYRDLNWRKIGLEIQRLRMLRPWSLEELATEAGISRQTVFLIESGASRPWMRTLHKIALALGVEAIEILDAGDDEDAA